MILRGNIIVKNVTSLEDGIVNNGGSLENVYSDTLTYIVGAKLDRKIDPNNSVMCNMMFCL